VKICRKGTVDAEEGEEMHQAEVRDDRFCTQFAKPAPHADTAQKHGGPLHDQERPLPEQPSERRPEDEVQIEVVGQQGVCSAEEEHGICHAPMGIGNGGVRVEAEVQRVGAEKQVVRHEDERVEHSKKEEHDQRCLVIPHHGADVCGARKHGRKGTGNGARMLQGT
jgi:hypothetical protein